jgi:hypothetical protein
MKKLVILIATVITLTSCSKSVDTPTQPTQQVVSNQLTAQSGELVIKINNEVITFKASNWSKTNSSATTIVISGQDNSKGLTIYEKITGAIPGVTSTEGTFAGLIDKATKTTIAYESGGILKYTINNNLATGSYKGSKFEIVFKDLKFI